MAAKPIAVALLSVAATLLAWGCTGEPYSGETCVEGEACAPPVGVTGGRPLCTGGGFCACLKEGEVACCSNGQETCGSEELVCTAVSDCASIPPPECKMDDDCPGPPDHRCGVGRCIEGMCALEISFGEVIPNQYPGDCKVTTCSITGDLAVLVDPSDIPDDGNVCTYDTCEGDAPVNAMHPDATPCPGLESGVCSKGICKECSEPLGEDKCPLTNQICSYEWCVLWPQCVNGQKDAGETQIDGGGPSCGPVGPTGKCLQNSDCLFGVCKEGKCPYPTHSDGVKNGDETGTDCGYPGGPPCKDGDGCLGVDDCISSVCYKGICQAPTCTDATKNGTEIGSDCGGACPVCQN